MQDDDVSRDYGSKWKERLAEARARWSGAGPSLSMEALADLKLDIQEVDVSPPRDMALLWSGRDILTAVPLNEADPEGPKWWDKLSCREAEVFSRLGIACRLEDTAGGKFLSTCQLHYRENDPRFSVAQDIWGSLSYRFADAASGRVEVICEGAFEEGVFRAIELSAILANSKVTAINGLSRQCYSPDPPSAFSLLRRWDVERSRQYLGFTSSAPDSTPEERAAALDDFREIQLWYEQDFFETLGPNRELPALPDHVAKAKDISQASNSWKYSPSWRRFIVGSALAAAR